MKSCRGWRQAARRVLAMTLLALSIGDVAPAGERYTGQHDFVLGTSLDLQIEAESESAARAAEQQILDEIQRLSAIFSTWDAGSEMNRWLATSQTPVAVSPELFRLLETARKWQAQSHGVFHPGVAELTTVWKRAERTGRRPSAAELASVVHALRLDSFQLHPQDQTATRLNKGRLTFDAFAKGTIVDLAVEKALGDRSVVTGVVVNIGGDLRVAGSIEQPVGITNPFEDAVNATPVCTVRLKDAGLATSGNYRRGFQVGGQRFSHVIDPRTGEPCQHVASATVIAPTAETADALATIFSVVTTAEAADMAKEFPGVDYLLIDSNGQQITSPGWNRHLKHPSSAKPGTVALQESELLELVVNFELAKPAEGQYRRPYVAVWLEDADQYPVRTAVLWLQADSPGPRWHRDLLRWYKQDRIRKLADDRDLIDEISGATRGPGQYKAVFDGRDDAGQPLAAGKYTLFIEVAREHGTYQLIRQPLQLGKDPIAESKLKTNVEIKSGSYEYRAPQPAAASKGT